MNQRRSTGIRRLPSGHYQITFRDQSGVKRRESFAKAKDARAALDERRTAVRNNEYVAPAKIPTVDRAAKAWLEAKRVSRSRYGGPIKESTLEFWSNHINRFIVPTLGAYRLDVIDTALIEKKREAWIALGLAAPSVNKVLTTLSAIFTKQVALRNIRYNPVSLAERMAGGSNEVGENDTIDGHGSEMTSAQVYGPDEILRLIESAKPGFAKTILTTFALTGLRHGEGLALMWRDIDFEKREITIRRNWSGRYRNGEPVFFTPKTRHAMRRFCVPDELCLALKKWKLQCPPSRWDLMFPKIDGRPEDRKTVWRAFDAAVKKANENAHGDQKLRRLTVHSLRHSFASIHLMKGTPIPEVSAMLGHANVSITLSIYSHFIPKIQTDSSARLAAAIFNSQERISREPLAMNSMHDGSQSPSIGWITMGGGGGRSSDSGRKPSGKARISEPILKLKIQDGQVVDDAGKVYDLHEAAERIPWITAKQYPPPHQYAILERTPRPHWHVLNCAIQKHPDSYLAYFRGYQRPMRYWEFEERRYWRSASRNPYGVTHMLNRCLLTDVEAPRRVDQGAKPILDWDGPPWELPGGKWPEWFTLGSDGKYHYRRDLDPMWSKKR